MSSFAIHPIDPHEIAALLHGAHADPFRILGPHRVGYDLVVRIFRPDAKEVQVVAANDHGGLGGVGRVGDDVLVGKHVTTGG